MKDYNHIIQTIWTLQSRENVTSILEVMTVLLAVDKRKLLTCVVSVSQGVGQHKVSLKHLLIGQKVMKENKNKKGTVTPFFRSS